MRLTGSATELTTAATDVVLSLAAAGGIVLLQSLETAASWKIHLWSGTFALIALAAALGAVYHGLVLAGSPRALLWRILTVCLSMAIALFPETCMSLLFGSLTTTGFFTWCRPLA
jgi:hypothetical protein